jgi:hypothetical protein
MRRLVTTSMLSLSLAAGTAAAQYTTMEPVSAKLTLGAEAMLWWFQSSPTPVPIITDDVVGRANTNVLLGGGSVDTNPNPGFRLTMGYAISPAWSLDASFFYVGNRSTSSDVRSSGQLGSTDLLVPFYNVVRNREDVTELSLAPFYSGTAQTELTNSMMGAEVNLGWRLSASKPWDTGLFGGFRWWQLKEEYSITTSSPNNPPQPADIWNTSESFDATNNFYGGQVGARASWTRDAWVFNGALQVALGAMVQSVDVNGSLDTNNFSPTGATQTFPGGYFALPTNIGNHSRTVFAAIPELKLNIGYRFTPNATVSVGYDVLYASSVARPGKQLNRNINPTQSLSYTGDLPIAPTGPLQPTFSFNSSSFWAQAISVALNVRF